MTTTISPAAAGFSIHDAAIDALADATCAAAPGSPLDTFSSWANAVLDWFRPLADVAASFAAWWHAPSPSPVSAPTPCEPAVWTPGPASLAWQAEHRGDQGNGLSPEVIVTAPGGQLTFSANEPVLVGFVDLMDGQIHLAADRSPQQMALTLADGVYELKAHDADLQEAAIFANSATSPVSLVVQVSGGVPMWIQKMACFRADGAQGPRALVAGMGVEEHASVAGLPADVPAHWDTMTAPPLPSGANAMLDVVPSPGVLG